MRTAWLLTLGAVGLLGCQGATVGEPETRSITRAVRQQVYQRVLTGGNASAGGGDQFTRWWVDVGESGSKAYVAYWLSSVDPTSEVCDEIPFPPKNPLMPPPPPYRFCYYTRFIDENGYGTVAGSDVSFKAKGARLDTTVAHDGTTYTIRRCVIDIKAGTYSCDNSGGGDIKITWTADGLFSSFQSGARVDEFQTVTYKTVGTFRTYSAQAAGSVFGVSASVPFAQVRLTNGASITKGVLLPPPPSLPLP